ncbi:unnamed protein product [Mytilus edulis]|uniref:DZIP3-like HEPN domain-containing protein n=1 Tax=Mytilus edulis TaxID=6550 RepID=A0A8S3SEG4_MYTED|nr:unnamed protein product [Mytilus edulis]
MEDTKKILQKFYVTLRNNVNATAVYREVLGLSQFDRELIIAQRTNTEAVDKLVDIVGSRSTRSFVSFVDALKKHDHIEIVDNILLVAKQNYPQIHRVLVTPTATVPPSSNTHSCPCVVDNQASQNTPNGRNNQNYIRHGQNEAAATQDTEESDSENESSILTLDTKLTQIAYEDVMQWVEELNKSKQWKKLATKMKLNYQTVKDLETKVGSNHQFLHIIRLKPVLKLSLDPRSRLLQCIIFLTKRMATSLSQEDVNFLRLAGLLIRVAPRAVRKRFDFEFHPEQLQQFLRTNRGKIYDLTYKKRIITLAQYDVLYPKGSSGVSSDMFDVSLMVCLLRNFTDLDIQDSLPIGTIYTDAADISRIKFYRNSIVHHDSGKIDGNEFSKVWNCVAEAIHRLLPDLKEEIDSLISSPLTNVNVMRDLIQLEKNLESTSQHMLTMNKKMATLETEKNNIKEIQLRTLKEWKDTDTKFIATSATTFILQSLKNSRGVIITGSPGCGKSAAAHHVAFELENEGYEILPCDDPSEIVKHLSTEKFQVFVIDDVCGKFSLNQQKADSWEQNDGKLNMLIESSNQNDDDEDNCSKPEAKFIITCRENIFVHKAFPKLTCFSLVQCSFSSDYKISQEEMRNIALSYLPENTVNDIKNICLNNKFRKDELRCEDVKQLVNDICWDTKMESVSIVAILNSFERLKGIYITESDDIYTAIHDKMFDIISAAIAPSIMKCLIEHVDIAFLANRTYLSSFSQNSVPFVIHIPQEFESLYLKRQCQEVLKGKYWEVFGSIQTEHEAYRKLLLSVLKQQDTCQQISYDSVEEGNTPLYVSSHLGYLDFVEYFVAKCANHIKVKDKEGRSPFYVACEKGHIAVVRYLMKHHANIDTQNVDDTTALSATCLNGHTEVAQLLLDNKADINITNKLISRVDSTIKNNTGWSAFHVACLNGHLEVVKLLFDAGVKNLNDTTNAGSTPLYQACLKGQFDIVKYLLDLNGKTLNSRVDTTIKEKDGFSVLHIACFKGHLEVVKLLIDVGMNLNDTTNAGSTPLHMACQNGHYETVKFLLDLNGQTLNSRVDTTIKETDGWSVLHIACFKGHLEVVKLLIDVGMNLNDTTNAGSTPLYQACRKGQFDIVKYLLDLNGQTLNSRVDTTIKDKYGWSVLHIACFKGHLEVVKLLIDVGMNLNDTTTINSTPLYMACQNGHYETVKFLLDLNCQVLNSRVDTTIKETDGWSVLHRACFKGHLEIVKLLIDVGMNLNDTTNAGSTPLYQACQNGHYETVKYLLDLNDKTLNSRVDTTIKQKDGWSVLHIACFNGHLEVVKLLVDVGMNLNDTTNAGYTPLYQACRKGRFDIVKYLLDLNGKTLNSRVDTLIKDTNGWSALHTACFNGHAGILKLLIGVGMDINERDHSGKTAVHLASINGHGDIVKILKDNCAELKTYDSDKRTPLMSAKDNGCLIL